MLSDSDLMYYKRDSNSSIKTMNEINNNNNIKNKEMPSDDSNPVTKKTHSCKYCCFSLCFLCHFVCPCCKFHSVKMYVLVLSFMILSHTMISSGYISGIMSSLQRQYNMATSKIGIILSSFDILGVFATPIMSFLGAKTNRPRLIAIFSLIYILGCGIFTLPYFLGSKYIVNSSDKLVNYTVETIMYDTFDLCRINNATNMNIIQTFTKNSTYECSRDNTNTWAYYVFITGQLAMSLGVSPLFSLGLTYLCDNLEERSHALYTGFLYGAYSLGPALGYVLASFLLSAWVNPTDPNPPNIPESDPRWVGLWWVGFLCSAGLMFVFFCFMVSFPERLPDGLHIKAKESNASVQKGLQTSQPSLSVNASNTNSVVTMTSEVSLAENISNNQITKTETKNILQKFKGFLRSLITLLIQVDYILVVLAISLESILAAGFSSFMVKFTEAQFQVAPSKSSVLTGGVVVPSAIIGAVLGGFIVRKFDLQMEGCIRLILSASTVVLIGIGALLLVRCPGTPSIGIDIVNQSFNKTTSFCNKQCSCEFSYSPICAPNGLTYASSCLAGCTHANTSGYYGCSCLDSNNDSNFKATMGACSRDCQDKLIIFMFVLFVVIAAEGLCITPATILVLKAVDKSMQSFSLGLMKCLNILLAYIPAPIVFSKLIDNTCILWNNECNDDKGTCLENDLTSFHYIFIGVALGVKLVSFAVCVILFIYIHKKKVFKSRYSKKIVLQTKSKKEERVYNSEIKSVMADVEINDKASLKSQNFKSKIDFNEKINNKNKNKNKNDNGIVCIGRAKSTESLDTIMTVLSSTSSNLSGTTFSSGSSGSSGRSGISNNNNNNRLSSTIKSNDSSNIITSQMDIILEEQGEVASSF